ERRERNKNTSQLEYEKRNVANGRKTKREKENLRKGQSIRYFVRCRKLDKIRSADIGTELKITESAVDKVQKCKTKWKTHIGKPNVRRTSSQTNSRIYRPSGTRIIGRSRKRWIDEAGTKLLGDTNAFRIGWIQGMADAYRNITIDVGILDHPRGSYLTSHSGHRKVVIKERMKERKRNKKREYTTWHCSNEVN
ncbi:hypothetical protein C0J52_27937, partial [Blattella germanica]